jgi:1-acyl-sn-glycerol-3-phosphate acyltransferase
MSGAFYLAIKAQAEVVPVAIAGSYEVLPMNHFHIRPGPIRLLLGQPIPTAGLSLHDIEALGRRVQQAIERMYYAHARVPDPARAATQSVAGMP